MSIESAMQRIQQLSQMTGQPITPAQTSSASTVAQTSFANSQNTFAAQLAEAQEQMQDNALAGFSDDDDGSSDDATSLGLASTTSMFAPGMLSGQSDPTGALAGYPYASAGLSGGLSSGLDGLSGLSGLSGGLSGLSSSSLGGLYGAYGTSTVGAPMAGGNSIGQRMVALAQTQVGVTEQPPGSNDGPQLRMYRSATAGAENTPGPWCSYFVSWLANQAGAPIGPSGQGIGYVPTLEAWGKQTGRFFSGSMPQTGDICIFAGSGGLPDHTGIVEGVDPDGTIHTIEGNSSNAVTRHTYSLDQIQGFVRPG